MALVLAGSFQGQARPVLLRNTQHLMRARPRKQNHWRRFGVLAEDIVPC